MMNTNILILVGSPRRNGNSNLLANAFIEGVNKEVYTIDRVNISEFNISGCIGCDRCWENGYPCIIKDDMQHIYILLERSDILVLVLPIYFYGFPSQLKAVIDRFYPYCRKDTPKPLNIKKSAMIVCGETDHIERFIGVAVTYNILVKRYNWEDKGVLIVNALHGDKDIFENEWHQKARDLGGKI